MITGDLHDFDFLAGEWSIVNRTLRARGVGSDDWDEFPGSLRLYFLLGGLVNVDEIAFPTKVGLDRACAFSTSNDTNGPFIGSAAWPVCFSRLS
jgi:hypothetical protein